MKHRKARELRVRNSRAKHETDKYFRQPSKNRSSGSLFSLHVRYTTNDILEHSTLVMITICAHIALLKKKLLHFSINTHGRRGFRKNYVKSNSIIFLCWNYRNGHFGELMRGSLRGFFGSINVFGFIFSCISI